MRALLLMLDGWEIRIGEIVERLHRVVSHTEPAIAAIKGRIRASPAGQADETGWREDGANGSLWSACTPTLRSEEDHTCQRETSSLAVVGPDVAGVLGSDCSAASNSHQGLYQRRWVYSLRALPQMRGCCGPGVFEEAVARIEHGPDASLSPHQQQRAGVVPPLCSDAGLSTPPL
jgi:hypothetical protein